MFRYLWHLIFLSIRFGNDADTLSHVWNRPTIFVLCEDGLLYNIKITGALIANGFCGTEGDRRSLCLTVKINASFIEDVRAGVVSQPDAEQRENCWGFQAPATGETLSRKLRGVCVCVWWWGFIRAPTLCTGPSLTALFQHSARQLLLKVHSRVCDGRERTIMI